MCKTFAEEAGIALDDAPEPLFKLLVLCSLQAKPIRAQVAVAAARGLFAAGLTTPEALLRAPRAKLREMSELLLRDYGGDLRKLREGAPKSLEVFDGVGPACAQMFAREAQGVWPELAPVFDTKALAGAEKLGLPKDPGKLAELAADPASEWPSELPRFAALLVREKLS